jgi:hypothetical protein
MLLLRSHLQSALQNLVVLLPLVFSGLAWDARLSGRALAGYALITALSVVHAELLSGRWRRGAGIAAIGLYAALLAASAALHPRFALFVALYTALALFNGVQGRRVVVVDVLSISASVGLKGMAGVVLIDGHASSWGLICLFLAACTVALGQRRNELRHPGGQLRHVLSEYSPKLLDQMLAVVTSSTLVAYSVYVLAESSGPAGTWVIGTALLVDFGLFRYLYLVYHRDMSCGAELALLRDPQLLGCLALWLGLSYGIHHLT